MLAAKHLTRPCSLAGCTRTRDTLAAISSKGRQTAVMLRLFTGRRRLAVASGVAAATAILLAAFLFHGDAARATLPGANGKIAFSSDRDGNFEVYVMNADGSDQTRLTNAPGRD